MNQNEQYQYQKDLFDELDKNVMTWDDDLYKWYGYALRALDFASIYSLGISQGWYNNVTTIRYEEVTGLKMSVVKILNNNLLNRTPDEMGYTAQEWAKIIELNVKIARRFNALAMPIEEALKKRYTIMNANGLRSVPKQ